MEFIIALQGDVYILMSADVSSWRSFLIITDDMDNIRYLDAHKLSGVASVPGDVKTISEHVQKDVVL